MCVARAHAQVLDGTKSENGWLKSKLGANAILGVSMALSRAGAAAAEMPLYAYIAKLAGKPTDAFTLPVPFFNLINGGERSNTVAAFTSLVWLFVPFFNIIDGAA